MNNINPNLLIGIIICAAAIIITLGFWINSLKKDLRNRQSAIDRLAGEKKELAGTIKWFVDSLKLMHEAFKNTASLNMVDKTLYLMERDIPVNDEFGKWGLVRSIYVTFYAAKFELTFNQLSETSGMAVLVSSKTKYLDLHSYIKRNPDFKEKSMKILAREIVDVKNYEGLCRLVYDQINQWEPFNHWKDEVNVLIQAKALGLTREDLEFSTKILQQKLGLNVLSDDQFKDIANVVLQVNDDLFERTTFVTPEALDDLKQKFEPLFFRAVNKLREWRSDSKRANLFTSVIAAYEKTYNKEKENAEAGSGS